MGQEMQGENPNLLCKEFRFVYNGSSERLGARVNMKGINTFTLKMIAVFSMVIDHVGLVFFPKWIILRILGRIAFPIFAYLLVEGFFHTRDARKYLMRLGICAIVSEVPYDLAFSGKIIDIEYQNTLFTLFLGLLMLTWLVRANSVWQQVFILALIVSISILLRTDYDALGILMILLFYYFRQKFSITLYNGRPGVKQKAFFYVFYPAHLLVIFFLHLLI